MSKEKKTSAPPSTATEIQNPDSESGKGNKPAIPKLQINLNLPTRDLGASVDVVLNLEAGKKPMQANYHTTSSHTEFYGECPIPGEHTISRTTLARIKADNGSNVIPVKVSWMSGQSCKTPGVQRCTSDTRTKDGYRPGSIMPLVHEMFLARKRITPLIQNIIDTGMKRVLEKENQNADQKAEEQSSAKKDKKKCSSCRQRKCTISIRKSNTKNADETLPQANVSKPRVSLTYTARVGVLRMNSIAETYNKIKPESYTNSGINLPSREPYSILFFDPKSDVKNFSKSISSSKSTNSSYENSSLTTDNEDSPLSNLKTYGKESPPHPFENVRNILQNFTKAMNDSKSIMDTKSCSDIMSDNISDMISSARNFKRMKSKGSPGYNPLADDGNDSFNKFSDILSNSLTLVSKHSSKSFYDDVPMDGSAKRNSCKNDLRIPKKSPSNSTVNTPIPSVTEETQETFKNETLRVNKESDFKSPDYGDLINQMIHLRNMLDSAINGIWKAKKKPQEASAAIQALQESLKFETTQWSFSKEISKKVYKDLYERAKNLKSCADDVISSHEMIFRQGSGSTDESKSRSRITLGGTLSTTVTNISGVKDKILGCLAELLEVKKYLDNCDSEENRAITNEILRIQRNAEASPDSSSRKKPVIHGSLEGIPVLFTMHTDRKISPKNQSDPPNARMHTPSPSLTSSSISELRNAIHEGEETDMLSEGNMEELPNSTSENETVWKGSPLSRDPEWKIYRQSANGKRRVYTVNKKNVEASSSSDPVAPVAVIKNPVAVGGYRKLPDVASAVRTTDGSKTEEYKEVQNTNVLNNSRITKVLRLQNKLPPSFEGIAVVEDSKETSEISSQEHSSTEKHSENGDLSLPYSDEDDDSQNRQVHYSDDGKPDSMTGDENLSADSSMVNLKLALQSILPARGSPTQGREGIILDEDYARKRMHRGAHAVIATEATFKKLERSSDDLVVMKYSDEDSNLKDSMDYVDAESLNSLPNLIEENKEVVSLITSKISSSSCTTSHSHHQQHITNWSIASSQGSKRSIAGDSIRSAEVMLCSKDRKLHFEQKGLCMEPRGQSYTHPSNKNQALRYIALPSDQGVTYVALPPDQAVTYVTLPRDQSNDVLSYPVISEKGKDDGDYKDVLLGGNEAPSLIPQQRSTIPSVSSDISVHETTAPHFPPKNYVMVQDTGHKTKNVSALSSCPTCGRGMSIPEQETNVFQTQIDIRRLSRLLEEEEEANSSSKEPPETPPMFEEEPLEINEESGTLLYKPSAASLPECCSQGESCNQKPVPRVHKKGSHASKRSVSSGDREISKSENNVPEVYSKKDRNASESSKRNSEEHKQIVPDHVPEAKHMSSKRGRRSYTGDSNPHVLPYSPSISSLPLDIEFSEEVSEGGEASTSLRSKGIEKTSMGDMPLGISSDVSLSSEKEEKPEPECQCKPLNHKINIGFFAKSPVPKSTAAVLEYQVNRLNITHGQRQSAHDTNQHVNSPSMLSSYTENNPKYTQEQATKQKRGFFSLTENDFSIQKSFQKALVDKIISHKPKAEIRKAKSGMDLKQKLKQISGYIDGNYRTTVKSEYILSSDDDNNPYYPSINSLPPQEFGKKSLVSAKDKGNGQQQGIPPTVSSEFDEKKSYVMKTADNSSIISESDAKTISSKEENDGSEHRRNKSRESQYTMSSFYPSSDSSAAQNFSCSTEEVSKHPRTAPGMKEHCSLPESTTNDKRHQRSEETFATPQRDERRRKRETSISKDARICGTNETKCSKSGLDSSRKQADKMESQELHAPADSKHLSRRRNLNETKINETQLQVENVLTSDLSYIDKPVKQKSPTQNHIQYENKRLKYLKASPLSQRLVTLTISSPTDNPDNDFNNVSTGEDPIRLGKDSKKTKEHKGNKHSYKSSNPDSEKDTESSTHTPGSKLTEKSTDTSTVNTCEYTSSATQILWALARVSVFDDGTKTLEVLHALPTPPQHYLLTDLGDVTVVRNEKYQTK